MFVLGINTIFIGRNEKKNGINENDTNILCAVKIIHIAVDLSTLWTAETVAQYDSNSSVGIPVSCVHPISISHDQ